MQNAEQIAARELAEELGITVAAAAEIVRESKPAPIPANPPPVAPPVHQAESANTEETPSPPPDDPTDT